MIHFFRPIPSKADVCMFTETEETLAAVATCLEQEAQGRDAMSFTQMPQWQDMLNIRKDLVIGGVFRKVEDEQDAPFIRMRVIAIRQAHKMMERAVSERDNPIDFFAEGIERRETACFIMIPKWGRRIRRECEVGTEWMPVRKRLLRMCFLSQLGAAQRRGVENTPGD
jgi:hypothetical protein